MEIYQTFTPSGSLHYKGTSFRHSISGTNSMISFTPQFNASQIRPLEIFTDQELPKFFNAQKYSKRLIKVW